MDFGRVFMEKYTRTNNFSARGFRGVFLVFFSLLWAFICDGSFLTEEDTYPPRQDGTMSGRSEP